MDSATKELVDTIRQTGFEVHSYLKNGHLEKIYENSLRNRLRKKGLQVEQRVIIELKAVRSIADEHIAQVLGYLRATNFKDGMLLNFGAPKYEVRKLVL